MVSRVSQAIALCVLSLALVLSLQVDLSEAQRAGRGRGRPGLDPCFSRCFRVNRQWFQQCLQWCRRQQQPVATTRRPTPRPIWTRSPIRTFAPVTPRPPIVSPGFPRPPLPPTTSLLTRRQEIRELSAAQVMQLRNAFRAAMENGRFGQVAGDHGVPNNFCPHADIAFLPWHRRFIRRFETALGISLPYWDWSRQGQCQ